MANVQMTFTGPVTINILSGTAPQAPATSVATTSPQSSVGIEASIKFDPDYANRPGYNPNFLGESAELKVPRPRIKPDRMDEVLKRRGSNEELVLKYHHFEIVMNESRRLQMWSAVNVDYDPAKKSSRNREEFGRDRWIPDRRIAAEAQIFDADFYKPAGNIDRGHIVRREDNAWGDSELEIEYANADTFHWTNCTPQHEAFNQSTPGMNDATYRGMTGVWGSFENHIQASRKGSGTRACVLAGPILDNESDPVADFGLGPIQYPLRFWKIVCIADDDGGDAKLKVFGFIFTQKPVVTRFGIERFDPGIFKRYQVSLRTIEDDAGLVFDKALHARDVMSGEQTEGIEVAADIRGLS